MLARHPIDPRILATDLGVAREFYGDRVGLELLIESDDFLTLSAGVTAASSSPGAPLARASRRPRPLGG
jgi:hypothetical protein